MRHSSLSTVVLAALAVVGCGGSSDAAIPDASVDDGSIDAGAEGGADGARADDTFGTDTPRDMGTDVPPGDGGPEPPLVTRAFTASSAPLLNPERGWMQGGGVAMLATDDLSKLRAEGYTLVYGDVRLDAWRTSKTLDPARLTGLDAAFASARAAGVKVVLRFSYNDPNTGPSEDAALDVVLAHLDQLAPIVRKNADVIAVWEAGFIGQWGEWHGSTNGLDTPTARKAVVDAELAALPASRAVQVRTPMFKADWFPAPLTDAQAFDGSAQARIGHHDDCFLASADDYGTYDAPVGKWMDYVAADTRFTPIGGETCAVYPAKTACDPARAEMARLHWSFLNDRYHPDVLAGWKTGGCSDDIGNRLGYRLSMTEAAWSARVRPGGVLHVTLSLSNSGYAAMFNPRGAHLALIGPSTTKPAVLPTIDPRRWAPGAPSTIDVRLRIPASIAPGSYRLALWLPDDAPAIHERPEYAVRLSNDGVWDEAKGWNVFAEGVAIDPAATGSVDPAAGELVALP